MSPPIQPDDFVPAIAVFPRLLVDILTLNNPDIYIRNWVPAVLLAGEEAQDVPGRALLRSLYQGVVSKFRAVEPRYDPSDAMAAIRSIWDIPGRVAEADAKHWRAGK